MTNTTTDNQQGQFTWMPIQAEAVTKLLSYQADRAPLLNVLKEMHGAGLKALPIVDYPEEGTKGTLRDIDPFTFLANFNRGLKDGNRIAMWKMLKEQWGLQSPLPTDFCGIPVVTPLKSWFIPYEYQRKEGDIDALWAIATKAMEGMGEVNDAMFQRALSIHGVALPNLTMGLFWLNPKVYIALDRKNRENLSKMGISPQVQSWDEYGSLIDRFHKEAEQTIPEFSHQAHVDSVNDSGRTDPAPTKDPHKRVWLIALGEGGRHWEALYQSGEAAIGWEYLGDLSQYTSELAIEEAIAKHENLQNRPANNAKTCWQFAHEIKPGDWIISKLGKSKVLGYGVVTSEYKYKPEAAHYTHRVAVDWKTEGEWEVDKDSLPLKTLTDYTDKPDALQEIFRLMGVDPSSTTGGDLPTIEINHLASPFNACFRSAEEAQALLDLAKKGLEGLGLGSDSKNDRRLALTLPQNKAGRAGTLRVNFGNWPVLSIIKQRDGQSFLQIACREDLVPKSAILETDTPFPVKDGSLILFIRFPTDRIAQEPIGDAVYKSMQSMAFQFKDWKGSPFRMHHKPELYGLFFDREKRAELLRDGLAGPTPSIAEEDETEVIGEALPQAYTKVEALKELFIDEATYDRMAKLLRRKKNLILEGPPGVGKSYLAKRLAYSLMGEKDGNRVTMIQFHQSYAYEDFIQGYRPSGGEGASFEKRNGVFYEFCEKARRNPDQDYYFIIDEINRGNLSRIFGELMLLVEADKRGPEHALPLTYSPDQTFHVPENIHIIGMMNTADRSLAMVDYALRRRFAFVALEPGFDSDKFSQHLLAQSVPPAIIERIRNGMRALNQQIASNDRDLGEGYCIGHSFFCPTEKVSDSEAWYREIVETEIKPLLQEYWADNANGKIADEIGKLLNGG